MARRKATNAVVWVGRPAWDDDARRRLREVVDLALEVGRTRHGDASARRETVAPERGSLDAGARKP